MKRRDFITLLGGAAAWPLAARAQQPERMRRIGVLMNLTADDPEAPGRVAAFAQGLGELGWTIGRNVRIDYRWGANDPDRGRRYADELIALVPDVILASGSTAVRPLLQVTRTSIVFVQVTDPVGLGLVASLARPGGNATGFMLYEYGMSGKWLELLKELAPRVARAGVLRDSSSPGGIGQFAAIQAVAPSMGMELSPLDVRDAGEIERVIALFGRSSDGGLIVTGSALAAAHRKLIVALAARHRLPAVYPFRYFATSGGLISYGPDTTDPFRRAAGYVDRILNGEKPGDLLVQAPTKYEATARISHLRCLKAKRAGPWSSQHACKLVVDYWEEGGSDEDLTTAARQGEKATARGHYARKPRADDWPRHGLSRDVTNQDVTRIVHHVDELIGADGSG